MAAGAMVAPSDGALQPASVPTLLSAPACETATATRTARESFMGQLPPVIRRLPTRGPSIARPVVRRCLTQLDRTEVGSCAAKSIGHVRQRLSPIHGCRSRL